MICFEVRTCSFANYETGIDMTIEYASKNFSGELLQWACMGLDFELEGRSQFYKKPLESKWSVA